MAKKPTKKKSSRSKAGAGLPGADARVVVFHGKDEYLRAVHTDRLVGLLREAHGEIDTVRFDGATDAPADILDECRSFDLMMRPKAVIVDEAEKVVKESSRALFERYAESPPESATLILRSGAWRPGNLDKAIRKVGAVVKCDPLGPAEAAQWAAGRCRKRHGAELEPEATRVLVERLGTDLGRIDSELGKLSTATGGEPITADRVRELVGRTREEEVWAIQSRLFGGPEEALAAVREAIGPWRQPPVMVMYACVDLLRKVHGAARLSAQGVPPGQIGKSLKLWGASQRAVMGAAGRVDPERAAAALRRVIGLDQGAKSGAIRPEVAPELAAMEFARLLGR